MTRDQILAYAVSLFSALADEAGTPLNDTATGLAYQLDAVIAATADDSDNAPAQQALIEYHALRKMRYSLAARPDFDATAKAAGRSQVFTQVDALIKDAAGRASAAGHPVATPAAYGLHALALDYLEPEIEQ